MCYGFVGPVAARMARTNETEARYYHVIRVGILAFVRGSAPIMSVEFARRAVPSSVRPSFKEMETACRGSKTAEPAAA
jgi:chemotaxis protein MotA